MYIYNKHIYICIHHISEIRLVSAFLTINACIYPLRNPSAGAWQPGGGGNAAAFGARTPRRQDWSQVYLLHPSYYSHLNNLHMLFIYIYIIIYDNTVGGKNPASPWMVKTL